MVASVSLFVGEDIHGVTETAGFTLCMHDRGFLSKYLVLATKLLFVMDREGRGPHYDHPFFGCHDNAIMQLTAAQVYYIIHLRAALSL